MAVGRLRVRWSAFLSRSPQRHQLLVFSCSQTIAAAVLVELRLWDPVPQTDFGDRGRSPRRASRESGRAQQLADGTPLDEVQASGLLPETTHVVSVPVSVNRA